MSLADVFAQIDADQRERALQNIWGHLAPRKNKTYRGHIVFAVGCFSEGRLNPTALECDFKDREHNDLDSSPWFYDRLCEFMSDQETEEGGIYRFDGTFRNYEFKGTIKRLRLVE